MIVKNNKICGRCNNHFCGRCYEHNKQSDVLDKACKNFIQLTAEYKLH